MDIDECVDGVHDRSGMMIVLKVVLILRETEFFVREYTILGKYEIVRERADNQTREKIYTPQGHTSYLPPNPKISLILLKKLN